MTGSLQIKKGYYYIVLNTYENGKRKSKWISTKLCVKGNKRKAEQMLYEALASFEEAKPSTEMLFSEYIRQWSNRIIHKVDEVTYQGYEKLLQTHILPYFDNAHLSLCEISVDVLQTFFDEKAIKGRLDGKGGLSPASLRRLKNLVNQPLKDAVKNGLLTSNPCQYVSLPKQERYQSQFYTATQLHALFQAIEGDPIAPLVRIAALYGLRRSEVLGLQWDSVDFENRTLTIKHTVTKITKTVTKDKTKNASSRRTFPLTHDAMEIFREAKQQEKQNRADCGKGYQENNYIFKWGNGQPFAVEYVSHHFKRLLEKHNLPPIRFHELRHSCASLLLNNGYTLKDVQEWMGHSDITMTANIYGHLDQTRKQDIANKLAHLVQ